MNDFTLLLTRGQYTMKHIAVINTGGTIAMSEDHTTGKVSPSSDNPLTAKSNLFSDLADLEVIDLFLKPSPHIRIDDMQTLSQFIHSISNRVDGVVVTHGTDTLEETAYYLELTLDLSIPIVVTGAMRSINEIGSDGLSNLRSAILVACDHESHDKGVKVVMNEEIHTATYVTKTHTTNLATFQTPTFGPNGIVSKNDVIYFQQLVRYEHYHVSSITKKVALIKAYAGMEADHILGVMNQGYDGLVIEGLGAGNLPPESVSAIDTLINEGKPVVMVSRAFNGITEDVYDYAGGGKQLHQKGVIFTLGLSGVKARIKLLVLLNSTDTIDIANAFTH